jgi:hypothetical protein
MKELVCPLCNDMSPGRIHLIGGGDYLLVCMTVTHPVTIHPYSGPPDIRPASTLHQLRNSYKTSGVSGFTFDPRFSESVESPTPAKP